MAPAAVCVVQGLLGGWPLNRWLYAWRLIGVIGSYTVAGHAFLVLPRLDRVALSVSILVASCMATVQGARQIRG